MLIMLCEDKLRVYLVGGQQGLGEGCAPVDRQARTGDLDPPVGTRGFIFRFPFRIHLFKRVKRGRPQRG